MTATVALLAGCGSHGRQATPSLPNASPQQASATRNYLTGPGQALITVNQIAAQVLSTTKAAECQTTEKTLASLVASNQPLQVPDGTLDELLADETSDLSAAVAACASGAPTKAAYASLRLAHDTVTARLRSDGLIK